LAFVVVEDTFDKIQVGIRSGNVPKMFDIVECEGTMALSKTGEKTVWCDNPKIVSVNHGDLPGFGQLEDGKLKVEKRYLDIMTNAKLKSNLLARSFVVSSLRRALYDKNFVEIETPVLSSVPSGASAKPFVTKSESLNENFYLRIATEIPLKKAIVAGFERVFEIGKVFRNEGIDKTHNPEFTSLEMYQSYATLHDMQQWMLEFLTQIGVPISTTGFDSVEYDDIVARHGEDFDKHLIRPTFVFGQPLSQTPLCQAREDGKAARFEFYMNGFEIANAYRELTDSVEQLNRFNGSLEKDDGLIEALKYGCPPLAGMGIGIERLVMALTGSDNIADTIFFPTKRN
jgi:lysyl-tRNA synthetase class 2